MSRPWIGRGTRALATAVPVGDYVRREQTDQTLDVTVADGSEEAPSELLALRLRRLEPWPPYLDLSPRANRDLSTVLLGLADDARDSS